MNPMGEQFEICHGSWTASVMQVGATLRSLTCEGRDIITSFAPDAYPAHSQGAQLLPWPNRIRDGRYTWGEVHQLPINEIERNNASHGLARERAWTLLEHTDASVTLELVVAPEPGWPGTLTCQITHRLTADGLHVEVSATNNKHGEKVPLPWGYGAHPYLVTPKLDQVTVQIPAQSIVLVDDRLLPTGIASVEATAYDFRKPQPLGSMNLDTCFTGLPTSWQIRVGDIYLWGDASMGFVQCYTPDERNCIAVEPMSCSPDAFNMGEKYGLVTLQPGASWTGAWGIGVRA